MGNKIILNLAMSIDGFIADPDGGYDWIQPSGDRSQNTAEVWSHKRFLEHISAVVMGKQCYRQQMHLEYGDKQVYVATGENRVDSGNIHFIGGDLCREVEALREKGDGDVYLFGGGKLIDPLLKGKLIDEYILGIIPMILGKGIPLFLGDNPVIPLHLTHTYVEDGIVVLRYVPRENAS